MPDSGLVIDLGMHKGLDAEFYLRKGFRVVAVEANPQMVKLARNRLASFVDSGRLVVENVGIGPSAGNFTFYLNLDNDEWSSFDRTVGTRQNTRFEQLEIRCITIEELLARHGMPYYLKIDVEGYDIHVVRGLSYLVERPKYISIEDSGPHCLNVLYESGVRKFKFLNQIHKWKIKLPDPPLEGAYVDIVFGATTSGPFGREVPGDWMTYEQASEAYINSVRPPGRPPIDGWWDIHGMYG